MCARPPAIGRQEISLTERESVALPALLHTSLTPNAVPVYRTSLFYFYCLRVDIVRVYAYTYRTVVAAIRSFVRKRVRSALSVREVFLSLDFPLGIITSRSAQIRDHSLSPLASPSREDRTKSARRHVRGRNIFNRQMPSCPAD